MVRTGDAIDGKGRSLAALGRSESSAAADRPFVEAPRRFDLQGVGSVPIDLTAAAGIGALVGYPGIERSGTLTNLSAKSFGIPVRTSLKGPHDPTR